MLKKLKQLIVFSSLGLSLSAAQAAPTGGTFIQGSGDITVNEEETVLNVTGFASGNGLPMAQVKFDSLNVDASEQFTLTCPIDSGNPQLPVVLISTDATTQSQVAGKIYSNSCIVLLASAGGWKTTATATLEMPGMMLAAADSVDMGFYIYTYSPELRLNNKPLQIDSATKFVWDYRATQSGTTLVPILHVNGVNTTPITMFYSDIYVLGDSANDALVSSGVWGGGSFTSNVPMDISGKIIATGRTANPELGTYQDLKFASSSSRPGSYPGYNYPDYPTPVADTLFSIGDIVFEGSQANPSLKKLSTTLLFSSLDVTEIAGGSLSTSAVNKKSTDNLNIKFQTSWASPVVQSLAGNITGDGIRLGLNKVDFTGAIAMSNQSTVELLGSNLAGSITAINSGVSVSSSKLAAGGSITVSGVGSTGKPVEASFTNFTNEGTITVPSALSNEILSCYNNATDSWSDCDAMVSTLKLTGTITNRGTMNIGHTFTSYGSLTVENFGTITSLADASLWADTLLNDGGIKAYGTVSASNQSGSGTITQAKKAAPQMFNVADLRRDAAVLTVNNYDNGWINLQKTVVTTPAAKIATPVLAKPTTAVVASKPAMMAAPVAVASKTVTALAQPAPVVVQKSAKTILTR